MTSNPAWAQSEDSLESARRLAEQVKGIVRDDHGRPIDAETGRLIDVNQTLNPTRKDPTP